MLSDVCELDYQLLANRLNPCSNGLCSLTPQGAVNISFRSSLNPCSNGLCSLTTWMASGALQAFGS